MGRDGAGAGKKEVVAMVVMVNTGRRLFAAVVTMRGKNMDGRRLCWWWV